MAVEPSSARDVVATEPLNLEGHKLMGHRVLLKLPTENGLKSKIIYSAFRLDLLYEVAQVGVGFEDRGIEEGDFILINPDLPHTQVSFMKIQKHKLAVVEFHEIFMVIKKGTQIDLQVEASE